MSFWKRLLGGESPDTPSSPPTPQAGEAMSPLDQVLGVLLETWNQRYQFSLNREKRELTLNVPSFQLVATEGSDDMIHLHFEEVGQRHRMECSVAEAPKVIEALLFPEEEK